MSSSQQQADRNRSVNDFDTKEGLKAALKSPTVRVAFDDTARAKLGVLASTEDDDYDNISIASSLEEQQELDWVLTNYNAELSQTQSLGEELKRLLCLKSYLLLDSERESSFERLTALASRMFRVPIALVSLVDLGRQWFMSNRGLGDARETPRKLAFCAHAILSDEDLFIINDARLDNRFKDNPLVTGPPLIRFYAGAPLRCPEGYKLGTFCIIDTKPRHSGLSLEEKQNLRELAAMAVDAMVQRKRDKLSFQRDKSRLIACTAHDLLTPLNGVQMSLSLLLEDEELLSKLSNLQKELLVTAGSCTNVMNRICQHAMESYRSSSSAEDTTTTSSTTMSSSPQDSGHVIVVQEFVENLQMVMEPYPKSVPLYITVEDHVPPMIVADDLKVFRAALNFLTNACKHTQKGNVHLRISILDAGGNTNKNDQVLFECQDTGPGIPLEHYPFLFRPFRAQDGIMDNDDCCITENNNKCHTTTTEQPSSPTPNMNNSGLGLYSVANQISSIGGDYGFRPPSESSGGGAVFWFSVPLCIPNNTLDASSRTNRASYKDLPELAQAQTVQLTRQAESLAQKIQNLSTSLAAPPTANSVHDNLEEDAKMEQAKNDDDNVGFHFSRENSATDDAMDVMEEEAIKPAAVAKKEAPPKKRIRRALVIDDSIVIRKSLSRALSKLGFDVKSAMNGLDGLKDLQTDVYDVCFCDFLMPVMDGLDCVKQYRDWEKIHLPWMHQYIVGISAHASPNDKEKGLQVGMDDFKSKPVTLQVLKELETSSKLQQVSKTLDNVLDPAKQQAAKHGAPQDVDSQHDVKRVKKNTGPVCLVGEDSTNVSKSMSHIMEANRWNPVLVHDGEDALRLLKMRNWDAVFLDEELPSLDGTRVIERFREWEKNHRVARQRNVFLISESFVPNPNNGSVSAAYPGGFDGALGKPILPTDLVNLLDTAAQSAAAASDSCDIVTR